jgi:imidazole glycerol-phosphate synthase subunit HisH
MSVVVVRLGAGNTASVMFALERLGVSAALSSEPAQIAEAERLILPGVAAAAHAMEQMRALGLLDLLRTFSRPMLGICLGQQLFYEESEEGPAEGLGLIAGRVKKLLPPQGAPLPHMGWSRLQLLRQDALVENVCSGEYAYFAHSYACDAGPETLAITAYGRPFSAIVAKDNRYGCQFHPERSGVLGQLILANFMSLPC